MYRLSTITIFVALLLTSTLARAQQWSWAKQSVAPGIGLLQYATSIDTDSAGNVYATGHANNTDFGCSTDTGQYDGFVVKLDPNGSCVWAKRIPCTGPLNITTVRTDHSHNVVLCGDFMGTLSDGQTTSYNRSVPGRFIIKLDSSGSNVWSLYDSIPSFSTWNDMVIDHGDSLYLIGSVRGAWPNSGREMIYTYYNPNGIKKWSGLSYINSPDSSKFMEGLDIELHPSGDIVCRVIAYGYHEFFGGPISRWPALDKPEVHLITFYGGKYPYFKPLGCTVPDSTFLEGGLAVDNHGWVYVAGYTGDTCKLDTITMVPPISNTLTGYLLKTHTLDTAVWMHSFPASDSVVPVDIAFNSNGHISAVGTFTDSVQFRGLTAYANASQNTFLLDVDTLGNPICLTAAEEVVPVSMNTQGGVNYFAGSFSGTHSLNSGPVSTNNLTEILIGKYYSCGVPSSTHELVASDLTVYPNPTSGNVYIRTNQHTFSEVHVFDISGRFIDAPYSHGQINLRSCTAGMYFIRVTLKNGTVSVFRIEKL